jgi:hypothetical protein
MELESQEFLRGKKNWTLTSLHCSGRLSCCSNVGWRNQIFFLWRIRKKIFARDLSGKRNRFWYREFVSWRNMATGWRYQQWLNKFRSKVKEFGSSCLMRVMTQAILLSYYYYLGFIPRLIGQELSSLKIMHGTDFECIWKHEGMESQKERDHWEDQDVGGWTILKWIL